MSTTSLFRQPEEILTLKNAVSETLNKKGILGKLKAEIRANVFAVLQDQKKDLYGENLKLQRLKSSREGKLLLDMLSEFLEFFELGYTNSVFSAEVNLVDKFDVSLRPIISSEIGLANDAQMAEEPTLLTLLRQYESLAKSAAKQKIGSVTNLSGGGSRDTLAMGSPPRKVVLDDDSGDAGLKGREGGLKDIDMVSRPTPPIPLTAPPMPPAPLLQAASKPPTILQVEPVVVPKTAELTAVTVETQRMEKTLAAHAPPVAASPASKAALERRSSLPPLVPSQTSLADSLSHATSSPLPPLPIAPPKQKEKPADVDEGDYDLDFEEIPEQLNFGDDDYLPPDVDVGSISPPPQFVKMNLKQEPENPAFEDEDLNPLEISSGANNEIEEEDYF